MKNWMNILIALSLLVACNTGKKVQEEHIVNNEEKVVVAYVTSWSNIMPDPAYITHINYAFGHVTDSFDGVKIDNEERLKTLVQLKESYPGLKIMLSIGGWGSGRFSEMAADFSNRKKFAKDCRRVVDQFGLDGIDIDWEYPTSALANISASPDDTDNFTLLMQDIRDAIGSDKLLTLASAASADYINFKAIEPYMDFINIMTYDMGTPPRHHSALYDSQYAEGRTSHRSVQDHIEAGVPAHKLVLGMPFYGRGGKSLPGFIDYNKIEQLEGYTVNWDDEAKAPYLTDEDGDFVCGYDNPESLAIKCNYILENGLLGGMYWDYAGDNDKGDLRRTVYNTLNKK